MKKRCSSLLLILSLSLLVFTPRLHAQLVNPARTLPERAFSLDITPAWHMDRNVILFDGGGPALGAGMGYGLRYDMDLRLRYIYFLNGPDYIGADLQYMAYESRNTYFSLTGGLHRWEYFGADFSGTFTYTPRFEVNLSTGIDMDISFTEVVNPRMWIPLNFGWSLSDQLYLFAEYNLPINDRAWDLAVAGARIIFR